MTVGSALRMRPGFGWMLAFSAVFSLGANSLSSVLNQMCKGRGTGKGGGQRREREREREKEKGRRQGGEGDIECGILCEYGE